MPNGRGAERGLEVSAGELSVVAGVWEAAADAVAGVDLASLLADVRGLGDDETAKVLRLFCRRCDDAIRDLTADARAGAGHLRGSAESYEDVEASAAASLSQVDGRRDEGGVWV